MPLLTAVRLLARPLVAVALAAVMAAGTSVAPASATEAPTPYGRYGKPLALDAQSGVMQELRRVRSTASPQTLRSLRLIARYPSVNWFGGNDPRVFDWVRYRVEDAARQHAVAQMIAFNLPHRGCNEPDMEGPTTAAGYRAWFREFVRALGHHRAIVIVEPDSLGLASCLPVRLRLERYRLIRWAVGQLHRQGSWAYIDIGHSKWLPVRTAVNRLRASGIAQAAGFSLNSSNFRPNAELIPYGEAISKRVGRRHFVIDTSRNGVMPGTGSWCNPPDAGIGHVPSADTHVKRLDAYLWIKGPGGSDGTCNGGPPAGQWFASYANMLVRNARLHRVPVVPAALRR